MGAEQWMSSRASPGEQGTRASCESPAPSHSHSWPAQTLGTEPPSSSWAQPAAGASPGLGGLSSLVQADSTGDTKKSAQSAFQSAQDTSQGSCSSSSSRAEGQEMPCRASSPTPHLLGVQSAEGLLVEQRNPFRCTIREN